MHEGRSVHGGEWGCSFTNGGIVLTLSLSTPCHCADPYKCFYEGACGVQQRALGGDKVGAPLVMHL